MAGAAEEDEAGQACGAQREGAGVVRGQPAVDRQPARLSGRPPLHGAPGGAPLPGRAAPLPGPAAGAVLIMHLNCHCLTCLQPAISTSGNLTGRGGGHNCSTLTACIPEGKGPSVVKYGHAPGVHRNAPVPSEQAHSTESSRADQDRWWRRSVDEEQHPAAVHSQAQPQQMATPFSNGAPGYGSQQQHAPPRTGGSSTGGAAGSCGVVVTAQRGYSLPDTLGVAPPRHLTIPEHPERAASGCAPESSYIQPRVGANIGTMQQQQQQQQREAAQQALLGGGAWPRRRFQAPIVAASPTAASAAAAALALLPLAGQPAPPRGAVHRQPPALPICDAAVVAMPSVAEKATAAATPLTPECAVERGTPSDWRQDH